MKKLYWKKEQFSISYKGISFKCIYHSNNFVFEQV